MDRQLSGSQFIVGRGSRRVFTNRRGVGSYKLVMLRVARCGHVRVGW